MKKSVLIIQRRLTSYRVPLFEAMRERLGQSGIRLDVLYAPPAPEEESRNDSGQLTWGHRTNCTYIRKGSANLALLHIPPALVRRSDLVIATHENAQLANYPLMALQRAGLLKLAFWGHGANFQVKGAKRARDRFKAWTLCQAEWWFAYTQLSVDAIASSGFAPEKITCLNNSIDCGALVRWRGEITDDEISGLKQRLGLENKRVGVFLGSLSREKRLDFLFEATDLIHRADPDFALLIIGDGPFGDYVEKEAAHRPWVRRVGARHGRDKVLHLALGELLLNPGMVGLGIMDGFALGLPTITTDCGIHSPEIAYLASGGNGLMTADSSQTYADGIASLLADPLRLREMSDACRKDMARYSLEQMTSNFCDGICKALGQRVK